MDIMQSMDLIAKHLDLTCALKKIRKKKGLSQSDLSALSNVPLCTIKAYEQGTVDIAKAQAETLYELARTLNCTIEELFVNDKFPRKNGNSEVSNCIVFKQLPFLHNLWLTVNLTSLTELNIDFNNYSKNN